MKEYKFSDDLCKEVINNWDNLRKDLIAEGVEFLDENNIKIYKIFFILLYYI